MDDDDSIGVTFRFAVQDLAASQLPRYSQHRFEETEKSRETWKSFTNDEREALVDAFRVMLDGLYRDADRVVPYTLMSGAESELVTMQTEMLFTDLAAIAERKKVGAETRISHAKGVAMGLLGALRDESEEQFLRRIRATTKEGRTLTVHDSTRLLAILDEVKP